jgi:integrase
VEESPVLETITQAEIDEAERHDAEAADSYIREEWEEEAADAAAQSLLAALRRAGVPIGAPHAEQAQPESIGHAQTVKGGAAGAGTSLEKLAKDWATERKPDVRTIGIMQRVVRRFVEMVGQLSVQKITRAHVVAFKDALLAAGQTPVNTNKQLTNFSTLLNYAAGNLLLPVNPAAKVKVLVSKRAKETRRPWTVPELNMLLTGPVHARGERPGAGAGEAAYWLPLLGLFTGARLEELSQMHPSDVYEAPYDDAEGVHRTAWVLGITDREEGQEVKTGSSRRVIPIHAELIRLGFLEFAEAAKGRSRLFHELKPDIMGAESGNWSKWFGKYKRAQGVTDTTVVFHSLRHTWKARAREVGIEEAVSDAITGHTGGGVGRDYGGAYPLRPMVEAMARFKLSGLKLGRART